MAREKEGMKALDTVESSPVGGIPASMDESAPNGELGGPPPLLHVPTQRLLRLSAPLARDGGHTRHPTPTNADSTEPGVGSAHQFASPPDSARSHASANKSGSHGSGISSGASSLSGGTSGSTSSKAGTQLANVMLGRYGLPSEEDAHQHPLTRGSRLTPAIKDAGHRPFCHPWQMGLGLDPFAGSGHCLNAPGYSMGGKERVSHPSHHQAAAAAAAAAAANAAFNHRRFSESSVGYLSQEGHGYYHPRPQHHPVTRYDGSPSDSRSPPRWSPKGHRQKNGMMEESGHQDGAINLSTVREAASKEDQHLNGDITHNGENGHDNAVPSQLPRIPGKGTPVPALSGAAKRKSKATPTDPAAAAVAAAMQQSQQQQSLLLLAAQQGLTPQQMQDLQQQLMGGPQPSLMQQQQQQSLLLQHQQKLHEQALHQLNEQLQVNVLQQSQLLQAGSASSGEKTKTSKAVQQQLHQLAGQQQQLLQQISQIQMQQRQYLLACLMQPFGVPQGMMSATEMQQLWKEVAAQTGLEEAALKSLNGLSNPQTTPTSAATANGQAPHLPSPNFLTNGALDGFNLSGSGLGQESSGSNNNNKGSSSSSSSSSSLVSDVPADTALYRHNLCKWPGCDTRCDDFSYFLKHLNMEHILDDRSTAQARVQLQVVSQLEAQLVKEKELLQAMMQHLHMKSPGATSASTSSSSSSSLLSSSALPTSLSSSSILPVSTSVPLPLPPPLITPAKKPMEPKSGKCTPILPKHPLLPPFSSPPFLPTGPMVTSPMVPLPLPHTPSSQPHLLLSQPPPPLPTLLSSTSGAGSGVGGGSSNSSGGGGPIRRRVSDKCNLPISTEIQRNREFYKSTDVRPPFTYASLIRQAIIESPHRQLTLNEIYQWFQATFAYFRRNEATWKNAVRHNLSLHKCFARVENVKGAVWTVDEIEFYKRRPQKLSGGSIKSPSLNDPASYNETINATIRAAMGEASLALMAQGMDQDTAQDLSLKSVSASSSQDGLMAMARSLGDEEILMNIKREAGLDPDTPTFLDGPSPHGASPNHHHHLSPPPNRVVISLRDEDRENNQPMVSMVTSPTAAAAAATPHRHGQVGMVTSVDGLDAVERLSTQVDLRREEEALEEGCVRVSPTMADDFQNGAPGDYGAGEETYEREIAERESYERELADRESYEQELADRESYEREMVQQEQHQQEDVTAENQSEEEERRMEEEEMGGMEEEEGRMEQEGEDQEGEEEGLRIEGPQPSLEASDDDLVDNLPVFPVPQLQPVTSA